MFLKLNRFFKLRVFCEDGGDSADGDGGTGGDGSMLPDGEKGGGSGGDGGDGGANQWFLSEGVAGTGDKPEFFKSDKYKSVAAQAEAYNELEKKLGEKGGDVLGAPDGDYKITVPEGLDLKAEDLAADPLVNAVTAKAKEHNLSQTVVNDLLGAYLEAEAESIKVDTAEEMKLLGSNAEGRLKAMADWAAGNLDKESYEAFRGMATTAANIKALEALVSKSRENPMAGANDANANKGGMTPGKLREMKFATADNGDVKYNTDAEYRKEVDQAYKDYYGEGERQEVVG